MILFAMFLVFGIAIFIITATLGYFFREFIYTRAIHKRFKKLGYVILSMADNKSLDVNESSFFDSIILKGGGRFINYHYKRVSYLNQDQQQLSCKAIIKKYPFLITAVDYNFNA